MDGWPIVIGIIALIAFISCIPIETTTTQETLVNETVIEKLPAVTSIANITQEMHGSTLRTKGYLRIQPPTKDLGVVTYILFEGNDTIEIQGLTKNQQERVPEFTTSLAEVEGIYSKFDNGSIRAYYLLPYTGENRTYLKSSLQLVNETTYAPLFRKFFPKILTTHTSTKETQNSTKVILHQLNETLITKDYDKCSFFTLLKGDINQTVLYTCIAGMAILKNDPGKCKSIPRVVPHTFYVQEFCYSGIALTQNDTNMCNDLEPGLIQDGCRSIVQLKLEAS